jgi:hypothetical protein
MTYNIIDIDLTHSRIDEVYNLSGDSIKVINATSDCFIQFEDTSQGPINLLLVDEIKVKFTKFYISNVGVENKSIKIIVSENFNLDDRINIADYIKAPIPEPIPAPTPPPTPFLPGFGFRIPITIPHTKVIANEVNCPIYVRLRQNNFDFTKARNDGFDVCFTKDDGQTLLDFERDRHDGVNLKGDYMVKIPNISSVNDTKFFMYYGNPAATDISNPTAVWDINYVARWSLKEDPEGFAPQMKDSTVNANHGTTHGGMVSTQSIEGQISKALDFDGSDDHIAITRNSVLNNVFRGSYTISLFIKTADTAVRRLWGFLDGPDSGVHTVLMNFPNTGQLSFFSGSGRSVNSLIFSTSNLNNGVFRKLDFVRDGNILKGYIDGVYDSSRARITEAVTPILDLFIGKTGNWGEGTQQFKGIIDEVSISNIARSDSWINLQYKSQNNTLLSFELEESA